MSGVFTQFSCLYGTYLSKQQRNEVSDFGVKLAQAIHEDDADGVMDLIKEAAQEIDDPNYAESFMGFCQELIDDCDQLQKTGAASTLLPHLKNPTNIANAISVVGAGATLALAASPMIKDRIARRRRERQIGESVQQIVNENPTLRDDPNAHHYFRIIKNFAPDVAADPLLAGNVMRDMQTFGPRALTTTRVKDLLSLQREYGSYQREDSPNLEPLGKSLNEFSKATSKAVGSYTDNDVAPAAARSYGGGKSKSSAPYQKPKKTKGPLMVPTTLKSRPALPEPDHWEE